jgi:hypothetical protein
MLTQLRELEDGVLSTQSQVAGFLSRNAAGTAGKGLAFPCAGAIMRAPRGCLKRTG